MDLRGKSTGNHPFLSSDMVVSEEEENQAWDNHYCITKNVWNRNGRQAAIEWAYDPKKMYKMEYHHHQQWWVCMYVSEHQPTKPAPKAPCDASLPKPVAGLGASLVAWKEWHCYFQCILRAEGNPVTLQANTKSSNFELVVFWVLSKARIYWYTADTPNSLDTCSQAALDVESPVRKERSWLQNWSDAMPMNTYEYHLWKSWVLMLQQNWSQSWSFFFLSCTFSMGASLCCSSPHACRLNPSELPAFILGKTLRQKFQQISAMPNPSTPSLQSKVRQDPIHRIAPGTATHQTVVCSACGDTWSMRMGC